MALPDFRKHPYMPGRYFQPSLVDLVGPSTMVLEPWYVKSVGSEPVDKRTDLYYVFRYKT